VAVTPGSASAEAAVAGATDVAAGPGFDCSHPSEIEAAICADPALSADDRRLAALYVAAKPGVLGTGSSQLTAQRRFLKDLQTGCGQGAWKIPYGPHSLRECVAQNYHDRLEALAIADLFTIHDIALRELATQDPETASIDEAIYQYATIQDPALRTSKVAAIIAPVFDQVRVHPAQVFNGQHIAPFVDVRLEDIATAADAASSDDGFSRFLYTASNWYVPAAGHPHGLVIPCAALIRRPGLLDAFGERFAPGVDCDVMLPSTPRLDALITAAGKAQPPCGGTIVQDTGAELQQLMIGIRLNLRDAWSGPDRISLGGSTMGEDGKGFRARHAGAVRDAVEEMTRYYVASFRTPPAMARAQAGQVVDLIVKSLFSLCE
jgi:uncharacterized protein